MCLNKYNLELSKFYNYFCSLDNKESWICKGNFYDALNCKKTQNNSLVGSPDMIEIM